MLLTSVLSEDILVTVVRIEAGFHSRFNFFAKQHAAEVKRGRTCEPARFLEAVPKQSACHTEGCLWPLPSVEPQSNMSSFRVTPVPKYLFTPLQVVRQASFSLNRQSQDALSSLCAIRSFCVTWICVLIIWSPLNLWTCVNIFSC